MVSRGLQDQRERLDHWVQRERRDESPPAPLILPLRKAPWDTLAPVVHLETLACVEKMALQEPKVIIQEFWAVSMYPTSLYELHIKMVDDWLMFQERRATLGIRGR